MELFGLTPWEWALPILIGVTAGLATNAVAIWMLFHPYEPLRIGRIRVLPQGAIPQEIDRIAERIGETVGNELLTSDDLARTLASAGFRDRFDAALGASIRSVVDRDLGSVRDLTSEAQAEGIREVVEGVARKLRTGIELYLASPSFEERVRGVARAILTDFRGRPLGSLVPRDVRDDVLEGAHRLWAGLRDSPVLERTVADALRPPLERFLGSGKPLRHYVPARAVNLGEDVVERYLPLLLDRLGEALADPDTRSRLQETLRRMADRLLEAQRSWWRIVGRLVITERTLEQTVRAVEEGGVDEIVALLQTPEIQARLARAVNDGVEDLLDRPVGSLAGDLSEERISRLHQALTGRILYMIRHPETESVIVGRLEGLLRHAGARTVGELADLLGPERAAELGDQLAGWVVEVARGDHGRRLLDELVERRSEWLLTVPIGRIGDYLPGDVAQRAEAVLADPLWEVVQARVPQAVAALPVAEMVSSKIRGYPLAKVEELIWRISRRELVLIVYLGGFLGAVIGSALLLTMSVPAGLTALSFWICLSFLVVNLRG